MSKQTPSLAILGAGIGGLAVSACLRKFGIETTIYEQAPAFARIGAEFMSQTQTALNGPDGDTNFAILREGLQQCLRPGEDGTEIAYIMRWLTSFVRQGRSASEMQ